MNVHNLAKESALNYFLKHMQKLKFRKSKNQCPYEVLGWWVGVWELSGPNIHQYLFTLFQQRSASFTKLNC